MSLWYWFAFVWYWVILSNISGPFGYLYVFFGKMSIQILYSHLDWIIGNKGPSSHGYGFSSGHVWMWELDYKKAEHRRIDAFELWCWRRLLRVSWTARRSNQSILKEISPECSLGGLMLKLKLQYFGHLMRRADSLGKTLMLGKIKGRRRRGRQRMRWLDGIIDSMNMSLRQALGDSEGQGSLACCSTCGRK